MPDIYLEFSQTYFKKEPKEARVTIVNRSRRTCIVGYEYSIERKKDNSWEKVPLRNSSFNEIGLCIQPMSSMDINIDLANIKGEYEKGAYRVGKNMRLKSEDGYKDTICFCNFYII
jgi:hypothetical protein